MSFFDWCRTIATLLLCLCMPLLALRIPVSSIALSHVDWRVLSPRVRRDREGRQTSLRMSMTMFDVPLDVPGCGICATVPLV